MHESFNGFKSRPDPITGYEAICPRASETSMYNVEKTPAHSLLIGSSFIFAGNEENHKSNRKAMNMNWSNQKANPALKTKVGNK